MAYTMKYGTATLFEPGNDHTPIHDAKLKQRGDGFYTFSFTMPPGHQLYSQVQLYDAANLLDVWFDETLLFRGMITSIRKTFNLELVVEAESELAYLDRVELRYKPSDKTCQTAFGELIAMYNSYANLFGGQGVRKFLFAVDPQSQANQVGYTDPNNTNRLIIDAETSSPQSVLQIIKSKMLDPYGAFLRLRYDSEGRRLIGIFPNAPDTSDQEVIFGENLLDYEYTTTDEDFYNACYPIGATSTELEGPTVKTLQVAEDTVVGTNRIKLRTTSGTVTIRQDGIMMAGKYGLVAEPGESVTVGTSAVEVVVNPIMPYVIPAGTTVRYSDWAPTYYDNRNTLRRIREQSVGGWSADFEIVYNQASAAAHGIRCMTFQDSTIKDPEVLLSKAIAETTPHLEFTSSLTVSALDMAFYLDGFEHLQAGQKVHVISEPHGLDTYMYVTEADINLQDPSQTRYTLGNRDRSLTKRLRATNETQRAIRDTAIVEWNNTVPDSFIEGLS